jgi:hypothetical protein
MRCTDVSQDPRYYLWGPTASYYDAECTAAPSCISPWVLPPEETQALHDEGHGTTPYLIYARGVPDTPDPGQANFDKKLCTLILIQAGFSRDLGCDKKHAEKTKKYPHVAALEQYWRRVEFVAILIGHAGTTLTRTLDHLIDAFSTVCLRVDHTSANNGVTLPIADFNAKSHDYRLFESLPDALADLAQSRLLDILRNKKRLVEALPGAVRGNRAHATATPTHAHAAAQQRADITLHRTRTTRVPESTAITNFGTPALWNCIPHVGTDVLHFTLFVRGLFLSLFLQEIRNA